MITRTRLLSTLSAAMFACVTLQAHAADTGTAPIDMSGCNTAAYKRDWETNEESGKVLLAFQLDADGKVKAVKLVESSGWPDLDSASVRALKQCVFKSASSAAAPENWETVRYTWVLK